MNEYFRLFRVCLLLTKDVLVWVKHLYAERRMLEDIFGLKLKFQLLIAFLACVVAVFFLRMTSPVPFVPLHEVTQPFTANDTWSNSTSANQTSFEANNLKPPDAPTLEYCRTIWTDCMKNVEEQARDVTRMALYQTPAGLQFSKTPNQKATRPDQANCNNCLKKQDDIGFASLGPANIQLWGDNRLKGYYLSSPRNSVSETPNEKAKRPDVAICSKCLKKLDDDCLLHKEPTFNNPAGNSGISETETTALPSSKSSKSFVNSIGSHSTEDSGFASLD